MSTYTPPAIYWADSVTDPSPSSNRSFRWQSTSGTKHYYRGYNGATIDSGPMEIYYDTSDQKWHDSDTDHPNAFIVNTTQAVPSNWSAATDPSSATGTANTEYVHMRKNDGTHLFSFQMSGWSSAPSGPIGTLSGGSGAEIKDVVFVKDTDTAILVTFNWQNINNAYIMVEPEGTTATSPSYTIPLGGLGNQGTSAQYVTGLDDGHKVWVANAPYRYTHSRITWSFNKSTKKVSAIARFQDNGGDTINGFNQYADVALVRVTGATFNHGYSLAEAQADPANAHANHDGQPKTLSLSAGPGSRWAVCNIDATQYGTTFKVPSKRGRHRNFW